jgi:uncharacterized membrane protein YsdA (DUF1294 family)
MDLIEGIAAIWRIFGAVAFLIVLLGGGISFIHGRPGFRHPSDFI